MSISSAYSPERSWREGLSILAIAVLCTFAGPAGLLRAAPTQTPWQTNAYGTLSTNIAWNYAMGYHFTPLVNGQVTGVGGYFNGTKTVKLFNKATGTLLATATVSAANTWAYTAITPVNVTAGTTYTIAVYLAGSGASRRSSLSPALPRTFGDIRIESSTYAYTGSNPTARPTNAVTTTMYGQADIQFVPATTDTTPPSVTITSPSSGSWIIGTVSVSANATDNVGVAGVQFQLDGANLGPEDTTSPYSTSWDTTTATNTDHTLTAVARDAAGNRTTSAPVTVRVNNFIPDATPPTGSVTINGGVAYTNTTAVTLSLSAMDDSGTVAQMQFSNDNVTYSAPEAYATTKAWTLATGDGTKTVFAKFKDAAGNWSAAASDTIVLDTTAPSAPGLPTEGSSTTDYDYDADGAYTVYWPAASDPESGIVAHQYREQAGVGGVWASWTSTTASNSLSVSGRLHNVRYFYQVRAKNGAGLWSDWSPVSDGILVDTTAPTAVTVTDDGATTTSATSLHAMWTTSSDPESGVIDYQCLIRQDATTGPIIVDATSAGVVTEVTRTGLTLTSGTTYYLGVQAVNGAGVSSPISYSDGITVQAAAPTQTPWQTNAYGTLFTDLAYNYAMGYHFTPLVNGQVTGLGGYFNGTKTVKLFNKATGTLLASATVSAANTWAYTAITPVNVTAGTTYTIAVYLAGSGASRRSSLSPALPRTFGDIRIESSTYAYTGSNPTARPTNAVTTTMYGQADIQFVPGATPPDTTPPTINSVSPQPGPGLYAGDTLTISASVTDNDPSPLEYQFSVDGVIKQAWSATTTYSWATTSAMAGSHTITVEVRDAGGAASRTQTLYLYQKPPGLP